MKMEITGYCMGLKKVVKIVEPEIVTMKNGRKAVKGRAEEDRNYKVFKILGSAKIEQIEAELAG